MRAGRPRGPNTSPLSSDRLLALVGVPAACDARTTERLVTAAFRASAAGPVALLVGGRARQRVDALLDVLVRRFGTEVRGVLFLDPELRVERLMSLAATCRVVLVWSDALAADLRGRGLSVEHGAEGLATLEAMADGTSSREPDTVDVPSLIAIP